VKILAAETPDHHKDAAALFREYAEIPGIEACIDSLDLEVSSLPGEYVPPAGVLLLAYAGNEPAGCVAIGRGCSFGASSGARRPEGRWPKRRSRRRCGSVTGPCAWKPCPPR
jgi:hypothetical protein